jgi:hypothetical protein
MHRPHFICDSGSIFVIIVLRLTGSYVGLNRTCARCTVPKLLGRTSEVLLSK